MKHGFLPTSPDRRLEAVSGRLTGVTGGMQIILPAQLREACGAGAEPAQFGRQGCRCHSFGWCHVFNGEAPPGGKIMRVFVTGATGALRLTRPYPAEKRTL